MMPDSIIFERAAPPFDELLELYRGKLYLRRRAHSSGDWQPAVVVEKSCSLARAEAIAAERGLERSDKR